MNPGRAGIGHAWAYLPDLPERRFPRWKMQLLAPFGGFPREVMEVRPFWQHAVRLDNARLIELLGREEHTPIDEAVAAALYAE